MATKAPTLNVRLSAKEQLNLFSDLSTMLSAGIPILEAIDSLGQDSKGNLQKVVAELRRALNNGQSLTSALQRLPKAFDPITINLIDAAETGGTLDQTLEDIVRIQRKEMAFSASLRTTMIYPAFVAVIFSGIVVLMLTFVVPRVSKVFYSLRTHLPLPTRIMFGASAAFTAHWPVIVGIVILVLISFAIFIKYQKRLIVRTMLSLPGLRTLGNNIDFARFNRSFALMLHAGVPLDHALTLSQRVVQKQQIVAVVEQMRRDVNVGKGLASSLRAHPGIVPKMMARSIDTAETAGTLEKTVQNLSEYFDEQVEQNLKTVSSLLEPLLIVVVGVMVGALLIMIMGPMYGLISQIGSQ